jgi:hypothetical protein
MASIPVQTNVLSVNALNLNYFVFNIIYKLSVIYGSVMELDCFVFIENEADYNEDNGRALNFRVYILVLATESIGQSPRSGSSPPNSDISSPPSIPMVLYGLSVNPWCLLSTLIVTG